MRRGEAVGENGRAGALDIRLLGPITAERDGEAVSLGGPRQRAVLARLALVAGQVVTVDRLVDDVWAGDPPATAVNTLQSYVSLLRRALGDAQLLRREGPGYVLAVDARRPRRLPLRGPRRRGPRRGATRPGRGAARRRSGSGRVARSGARRRRRRGVGPAGRGALGRAAPGSPGDALRRPARPRPSRRGGRRAGADDRRAPAPRGVRPAPDDRPVPHRPPGRRAACVHPDARRASEELGLDPTPELSELQTAILNHDPSLAAPVPVPRGVAAVGVAAGRAPAEPAPAGVARGPARTGRARRRRRRSSAATSSWPRCTAVVGQPGRRQPHRPAGR